jgi:hypothetical protein
LFMPLFTAPHNVWYESPAFRVNPLVD